jgi:hypothetical protein
MNLAIGTIARWGIVTSCKARSGWVASQEMYQYANQIDLSSRISGYLVNLVQIVGHLALNRVNIF